MLRPRNLATVGLVCLWAALSVVGFVCRWRYEAVAAAADTPASAWPTESRIVRRSGSTLVLFAHPHCPCTRSSLAELARLAAFAQEKSDLHVVFIAPSGVDDSWQTSDLVSLAKSIPGVEVHFDTDRFETGLFQARTSGFCVLYDSAGSLEFAGGLTIARGHEGDSDGSRIVLELLDGMEVNATSTPVFGCSLFEPEAKNNHAPPVGTAL
jgi:hypothetical protein